MSRRFAIVSLVGASLWVIGAVSGHLARRAMAPSDPRWGRLGPTDAITGTSVGGSDAKLLRAGRHLLVVGDEDGQVPPQLEGSREMDGIKWQIASALAEA